MNAELYHTAISALSIATKENKFGQGQGSNSHPINPTYSPEFSVNDFLDLVKQTDVNFAGLFADDVVKYLNVPKSTEIPVKYSVTPIEQSYTIRQFQPSV